MCQNSFILGNAFTMTTNNHWKFSIENSSLTDKFARQKLTGALDICFILFETLQQCAPRDSDGSRTCNLSVQNHNVNIHENDNQLKHERLTMMSLFKIDITSR